MFSPTRAIIMANRLPFPLEDGWNMRTFHVVRNIGKLAETTLLVFHPGEDATLAAAREAFGPRVRVVTVPRPRNMLISLVRGAITRDPLHVWRQESAAFRSALRALVAEGPVDLCVSVTTFFRRYLDEFPRSTVRIVDTHNIDSLIIERYTRHDRSAARRLYARLTVSKMQWLERRVFESVHQVWVCSEQERAQLASQVPAARVRVVPNGVDTGRLVPLPEISPKPNRLIFFGKLDYSPNVDGFEHFVDDILPLLQRTHPMVEVVVLGAGDRTAIDRAASRNSAVRVVGRVEDIRPELAAAAIVIVPLRMGGGTRLKIVEALSMARPLVSTTIGAEGLALESGRELELADAPADFAAALARLLDDPDRAQRLGHAGRASMIEQYDWESIGRTMQKGLEECA